MISFQMTRAAATTGLLSSSSSWAIASFRVGQRVENLTYLGMCAEEGDDLIGVSERPVPQSDAFGIVAISVLIRSLPHRRALSPA